MSKKVLITWSAWLIGSEATKFFIDKGYIVVWIDNNMRKYFFGSEASTDRNRQQLLEAYNDKYIHFSIDIRNDEDVRRVFLEHRFDLIVHAAAQPSHDRAAKEPYTDFSVNANWTLVMLENYRIYNPQATFIFTSTNKVYWDTPNFLPLVEHETRYEINQDHKFFKYGIDESMSIDNSKHSIFWASKVAADIMVQEYWKYFWLNTWVFRWGCLTWPAHSWTQLHWFLAYLAKCIATGKEYTIFGYKWKQVRDNIHSYDLVNMFWHFHQNPVSWAVYNAWGARNSNISMLEAIQKFEKLFSKKAIYSYTDQNRSGDHIRYISDVSKFKSHYPKRDFTYNIDMILEDIAENWHF